MLVPLKWAWWRRRQAIFFKRQSVIFKTNSVDHEGHRGCAHFKTHFVDSVIFAAVGFFSSSVFCISFPGFPAFFHSGRTASVGLWEAIATEDTLAIFPYSRSCRSLGRNSIVWRENKSGCITSFLTNHSTEIWIAMFSRLRFTKYGNQ